VLAVPFLPLLFACLLLLCCPEKKKNIEQTPVSQLPNVPQTSPLIKKRERFLGGPFLPQRCKCQKKDLFSPVFLYSDNPDHPDVEGEKKNKRQGGE